MMELYLEVQNCSDSGAMYDELLAYGYKVNVTDLFLTVFVYGESMMEYDDIRRCVQICSRFGKVVDLTDDGR